MSALKQRIIVFMAVAIAIGGGLDAGDEGRKDINCVGN